LGKRTGGVIFYHMEISTFFSFKTSNGVGSLKSVFGVTRVSF